MKNIITFTLTILLALLLILSCRSLPIATAQLPENWPDDIPIMDGFVLKEVTTEVDPDTGKEVIVIQAIGRVNNEDAEDFYKNLPGWELAPEIDLGRLGVRISDTVVILGFDGDRTFNANIVTIDGETTLALTYIPW